MDEVKTEYEQDTIAIVGMAGRFPGAGNIDAFWQNLQNGVCSIEFFSSEEAVASGLDPAFLENPNFVKAYGVLDGIENFDASFFNMSPREARILDPQHRLFLECAWKALENAGYDSEKFDGRIGVYAGTGLSTYLLRSLLPSNMFTFVSAERLEMAITNQKDLMPMRVSYELNLTGPSINVNTTCSTSLVATHLACQSLKTYESDMVLAGGAFVRVPQKEGYLYQEGTVYSDDGYIRAFDAKAKGIVIGSGGGVVVLRRFEDALANGDTIYAVIRSTAVNNDGATKLGYTAPGVDGQAEATAEAISFAEIHSDTISYVEAHGTGTVLGDPIEFESLIRAFRATAADPDAQEKNFCALGSVKTNIGHTNHAAGVTSLIKTVLSLRDRKLVPSLHFDEPNPKLDFDNSPFYVNTTLKEWKSNGLPRRALINSFGIGGTNAHVVLEEAPEPEPSGNSRPLQLLLLSAKTGSALDKATANLLGHLERNPELNFADVAYTLKLGRKDLKYRRMLVCNDADDALNALKTPDPKRVLTSLADSEKPPVVFMFSGQGAQYVGMAEELYETEPVFREQINLCSEILIPHLGADLRHVMYPDEDKAEAAAGKLRQTGMTQPALFVIEYALARLWMSWGIHPRAMIGHSIGEYVAACLAGVFSLEDALSLVAARGQMMQQMPPGEMLAVSLAPEEMQPLLGEELSLSVINGPFMCVAGGTAEAVAALQQKLADKRVACTHLHTSHAFHSDMMDPIVEPFTRRVRSLDLKPPQMPYLSNVTGDWITAEQATDPGYWAGHMRQTVRFDDGLRKLLQEPEQILLEVGPGRTLSTLAKRHPDKAREQLTLTSVRHPKEKIQSDAAFLLTTLGKLWLAGVKVDWDGFYVHEHRHRVPLPTYPFERQRYWIDPPKHTDTGTAAKSSISEVAETFEDFAAQEESPAAYAASGMTSSGAPRNSKEQKIAEIWQKVLTIDEIGIHDDFFELGGNSLIAVALVARLRDALQTDLTTQEFLNAPTIAELAEWVEINAPAQDMAKTQRKPKLPASLVRIQSGSGQKTPLFLVHPIEGQVFFYRDLASCLNSERPVYAFQAPGLEGESEPFTRIEDMAAHYIKSMREIQADGPYLLGGTSFGGIVAFEMSQQLHALGQKTDLLFLADAPIPGQPTPFSLEDDTDILMFIARNLLKLDTESFSADGFRKLGPDEQISHLLEQAKTLGHLPPDFNASQFQQFVSVFKANEKAMKHYAPRPYPGRLTFFRPREQWKKETPYHPEFFWTDFAERGIEISTVPGNHITMNYQPNVRVMAERLMESIS